MAEKAAHVLREAAAWEQAQHEERKQAIQRKREYLEALPGLVDSYCAGAIKTMDVLLMDASDKKVQPRMDIDVLSEKLSLFFIEELAQVKDGVNGTIQRAITAGALHAAEMMQEESERVSSQLLELFEGVAEAYGAQRDVFLDHVSACGLNTGISKEQYDLRMKAQLAGVPPLEFGWVSTLWPNTKRLLDCNVIETIRSGIKLALSEWDRSTARYIRALRVALFTAVRQETESLPALRQSGVDGERAVRGILVQMETDHQERVRELSELAAQGAALLAGLYEQEEG